MLHMSISVKKYSFCTREGFRPINQAIDISRTMPPKSGGLAGALREFVTICDRAGPVKTISPAVFLIASVQAARSPWIGNFRK